MNLNTYCNLFPVNTNATYSVTNIWDIYCIAAEYINLAFILLIAVAILALAYGIFKFIVNASNEAERTKGRTYILWAVIGIFIMISVWGLINIISATVDLDDSNASIPNSIVPGYQR